MTLMRKIIDALAHNKLAENHIQSAQDRQSEISEDLSAVRRRTDRLYRLVSDMRRPPGDPAH